jgi:hypothetical protein
MKNLSLKSVKTFTEKNVFQNRIVLYVLAFIALIEILALAGMKDYNSVIIFLIIGFLASFFTKNMIVILLVAIVFTSVYRRLQEGAYEEGMENKEGIDEEDEEDKEESDIKENIENKKEEKDESKDLKNANEKKKDESKDLKNANEKKKVYNDLKKDFQDFQNIQKTILTNMKEIDPLLEKAENFISKFEQYKNKN